MPISCKYQTVSRKCREPEWVIAFLCDHCESDCTMEVCDGHYHSYYMDGAIRLACSHCQGSLSWVSERIDHASGAEVINE